MSMNLLRRSLLSPATHFNPSTFDPSTIAGLQMWLKADALALADGASVATWTDSSAAAHSPTNATVAQQPILHTNVVNGQPAVRFDGSAANLQASFGAALTQPATVFVVASFVDFAAARVIFDTGNAARQFFRLASTSGSFQIFGGATLLSPGSIATGTFTILQGLYNGASASQVRVGGGAATTGNAGTNSLGQMSLGHDTAAGWMKGDIAELLYWNANLSLADLDHVGRYLKAKYAVTWNTPS